MNQKSPMPQQAESSNDLLWHTEEIRIGDLIEWDKNPRTLSAKQAEDLRTSLKKFGYVEPVVVNFDRKSIVGGHQRRRVMLQRLLVDPSEMIECRVPNRQLTKPEFEELAIRLNKNTGEWALEILANEFDTEKLIDFGFVPSDFGMTDDSDQKQKYFDNQDSTVCKACGRPFGKD